MNAVLVVSNTAVIFGGAVLGGAWLYDLYHARFPTRAFREAMVADAMALGLRSAERDLSAVDLRFPFFKRKKAHGLIATFAAAVRPRVDWIFAGTWRGRDVRVFDYSRPEDDDAVVWTCATAALERSLPPISITRRDVLTGRLERLFDRDFRSGDEAFDHAFHVVTTAADSVQATLDDRVRGHLLESAPPFGVVEIDDDRLLVCGVRLPARDRKLLLDATDAIADALATAGH